MTHLDSTQRFTNRVDDYVRYRPSYPQAVIDCLRDEAGLTADTLVADIGSGTGILTRLFLDNGNPVVAAEPNDAMRAAAEADLSGYKGFNSIKGTAEHTTLPDAAVGMVVAGQAFHWFDPAASAREFGRILQPDGMVALLWNMRRYHEAGLMADYETMLQEFGLSYNDVKQSSRMSDITHVFGENYTARAFSNEQVFDFAGFKGRLLSSSYAPTAESPQFEPMIAHLRGLFDRYAQDGLVTIHYDTHLYFGAPIERPG